MRCDQEEDTDSFEDTDEVEPNPYAPIWDGSSSSTDYSSPEQTDSSQDANE